jgi:hypothetical protein
MAITVKADSEDFPGILSMLGLGGLPRMAEASDAASAAPATTPALLNDADSGVVSVRDAPSKLQLLQHTLSGGSHDDARAAVQGQPIPDSGPQALTAAAQGDTSGFIPPEPQPRLDLGTGKVLPPSDLTIPDNTRVRGTFAGEHPTLARILRIAATLGEGAAAGAGKRTAGEGFAAAHELTDPFRKQLENATLAEKQAAIAHTTAATEQIKSQVMLPNGLIVSGQLAQKLYPTLLTEQGKNVRAKSHDAITLRKAGMKLDDNGEPTPIPYEELSPAEQATIDLKKSQKDAADARAQYDKFKSNPDSEQYKLARERLRIAAQNASTAAGRLGLEGKKYVADYLGLDVSGSPLPGVSTDEQGRPIGPRIANAGAVSADRLRRGDLAANAIHNLNNVEDIINRRGEDLFGPVMGRITNVRDMIGSDDPDIAAAGVEIHNYALASNGAHGVRSQQAIEKTEDEILKHFKRGPEGAQGGITAAKDSLLDFVRDQQLGKRARPAAQPAGGATKQPQATHVYDPRTGTISPVAH